jgi:hypothetical protein
MTDVLLVHCQTRAMAEEWTWRYLAAAYTWAVTEPAALARIGHGHELHDAPNAREPSPTEIRAWARANGIPVADRGRLRPEIWETWHAANRAR